MKRASLLPLLSLVGIGSLFFACASGDTGFGGAGGGNGGGQTVGPSTTVAATTTNAVTSTVTATSTSATGGCISSCGINADCANTCPAVMAGESNCCDVGTHMCYVAASAQCPIPGTTSSNSSSATGY